MSVAGQYDLRDNRSRNLRDEEIPGGPGPNYINQDRDVGAPSSFRRTTVIDIARKAQEILESLGFLEESLSRVQDSLGAWPETNETQLSNAKDPSPPGNLVDMTFFALTSIESRLTLLQRRVAAVRSRVEGE